MTGRTCSVSTDNDDTSYTRMSLRIDKGWLLSGRKVIHSPWMYMLRSGREKSAAGIMQNGMGRSLIDPISMVIQIGDDHFFISGP